MGEDNNSKHVEWVKSLEDPGDKFEIGPMLGTGNSSAVHVATGPDGKRVAIKIQEESDGTIESIHEEHLILTELCCSNPRFPIFLGTYRRTDCFPHQIYFVMELCEEGSVQDILLKCKVRDCLLTEDVIAFILRETVMGLKDLHEQNIIHRDIKASNILITKDGDIKICDFGLSKHLDTPDEKVQAVVGNPYWIAPEVVASERLIESAYDSRADVWALGVTAAELGDCTAPLSNVYAPRAIFQVVQNPPQGLRKPSDWSQLYNDFISECLEKNPDHRPWAVELVEHPFIKDLTGGTDKTRGNLLKLLNKVREDPPPLVDPEVTVRSETIKMDRHSAPIPMYRDDLAMLYSASEEAVVETLNQRFAQGNIYTFLGDVLIVVNPFHELPLYGSEIAEKFRYRARCDNAPHIYAVGDQAFQDMLHHQELQNILLTGETGSGKTTAGKHLLWHLANMTASNKKMVDRIMKVSTVMEAFGNAATTFNQSSTRHIQYLELTFTKSGKLSGAILWAYCLEKWRVTSCGRNQSNFHIFYYLMDTLCSTDTAGKYHLEKGKNYEYLPSSPAHVPGSNVEKLQELKEAFTTLDFSLEEQETIVKILCAILLVGQINLKGEEIAEVQNPDVVDKIASLLDLDARKFEWTLVNYCVVTAGEAVKGQNTLQEAEETRGSLARSLYCRLVDWIVNLVNTKLSFTRLVFGDQHSLGILDIPGFECFPQDNTLDQFLINMTNEQMQFFYNQRVFIWEMQDLEREELSPVSYNYHDNRELLDIVLSKPTGLLAFLDDETKSAGNDHKNFLGSIQNKLHSRFIRLADAEGGSDFTVAHYSGQVIYDARNFVERNKNFLSPEMIEVMRQSSNPTVVQLYSNQMTKTGNLTISEDDVKQTGWTSALSRQPHKQKRFNTKSRGKFSQSRQMQTIAATMRNSLLEMLQKASEGDSHFVRCLRSNLKSTQFSFSRDLIRYQIRALGIVDSIHVRQLGYSRRLRFSEFLRRYKFLAFDFDEKVDETRDNCRLLLIRLKMEGWALGKNRVLLKYYNEEYLSRLYENQVNKVVKIQALMRAFLARKKTNTKYPRLAELRQGQRMEVHSLGTRPLYVYILETFEVRKITEYDYTDSDPTHNRYASDPSVVSMVTSKSSCYSKQSDAGFSERKGGSSSAVPFLRRDSSDEFNRPYSSCTTDSSGPTPVPPQDLDRRSSGFGRICTSAVRPAESSSGTTTGFGRQLKESLNNNNVNMMKLSRKTEDSSMNNNFSKINEVYESSEYLSPSKTEAEMDTSRPTSPSPRDIAKAFEAAIKENYKSASAFAGRNRPSTNHSPIPAPGPRPIPVSPVVKQVGSRGLGFAPSLYEQKSFIPGPRPQVPYNSKDGHGDLKLASIGKTSSPEIIHPMHEFTNMASKFLNGGTHSNQEFLKKSSNINFRDLGATDLPPPMPQVYQNIQANSNSFPPIGGNAVGDGSTKFPGYSYHQGSKGAGDYPNEQPLMKAIVDPNLKSFAAPKTDSDAGTTDNVQAIAGEWMKATIATIDDDMEISPPNFSPPLVPENSPNLESFGIEKIDSDIDTPDNLQEIASIWMKATVANPEDEMEIETSPPNFSPPFPVNSQTFESFTAPETELDTDAVNLKVITNTWIKATADAVEDEMEITTPLGDVAIPDFSPPLPPENSSDSPVPSLRSRHTTSESERVALSMDSPPSPPLYADRTPSRRGSYIEPCGALASVVFEGDEEEL